MHHVCSAIEGPGVDHGWTVRVSTWIHLPVPVPVAPAYRNPNIGICKWWFQVITSTVGQVNVLTVKSPSNLATPLKCHWPFMFILLIPFGDLMPHSMNQWSRRFGFVRWTPTYEKNIMMIPRIFKLSYHEGCPGLCRDNRVYRCPYRTEYLDDLASPSASATEGVTLLINFLFYFILFYFLTFDVRAVRWVPSLKEQSGPTWKQDAGSTGWYPVDMPGAQAEALLHISRLLRQREERLGTCYLVLITWIVAWLGRLWPQWTVFQFKQVYATAAVIIQVEIP
jgi:hypothetical protein